MLDAFSLLKEKQYEAALLSFQHQANQFRPGSNEHNNCLYGQARAYFEMQQYDLAEKILLDIIVRKKRWVAPHITLCRLYEKTHRLDAAESAYIRGLHATHGNKELRGNYQWYLKNLIPPQYTPALRATQTQDFLQVLAIT